MLVDVVYPETPITLQDLHLIGNQSIQHLRAAAGKRLRSGQRRLSKLTHFVFLEKYKIGGKNDLQKF